MKFSTDSKIDEIAELASTLDLAKKMNYLKTDELRRDLLANVGHDLKDTTYYDKKRMLK
ncbi:MAG: hypothetical protein L6V81_07625 [Clostridium sp.]|nr:MAG: hypothetical protein L6V81_07625 [Clostridium sp.]